MYDTNLKKIAFMLSLMAEGDAVRATADDLVEI